ncbi:MULTISPECIES: hypothetical protein [Undibacterium]|jgi:hypothetical protein|uniref:Uncharacterized protein n=2 Tax=Undibacterium TaxID=401469 RepID=A0A941DD87_9BURK|nr:MULTISPECIES: hypothetical protein [Undibacterium]MBR7746559.1 hypothetical protein [Undibacterium baiyunense]GGX05227.1 hypothetical protein GCM10011282_09500 [Undibacterium macrobrachii]
MFTEDDFFAISKFLKLGVKITVKNPMGQRPLFACNFPNPKGGVVNIEVSSLYDVERKLRALLASDIPVKTKLTPFTYLGTNFEGVLYCVKGTNDFVVQETRNLFGMESKAVIRSAEHFIQLLQ